MLFCRPTGPRYVTDRYAEFLHKDNLTTLDKQIFFSLHYEAYIKIAKNNNDLQNRINLFKQDESIYGQHHSNGHWL